jgi:engulfment and cell motility protein 1
MSHESFVQYALTAMQNLMDLDYGWATLDDAFIFKVVQILSSSQSLINVCRPATAILKKLVEADPANTPGPVPPSSSRNPPPVPVAAPGSVYRYGFHVVFEQMRKERGLLETVVGRLGSQDTAMTQYRYVLSLALYTRSVSQQPRVDSMMLINSLLSHVNDARWDEFIGELERLNVRKAVVVCAQQFCCSKSG